MFNSTLYFTVIIAFVLGVLGYMLLTIVGMWLTFIVLLPLFSILIIYDLSKRY